MALCKKKETYLSNLKTVNTQAGVEPELVDLIVAYARLRLEKHLDVTFYQEGIGQKIDKHPYIKAIIDKNKEVDPRVLNFLAAYYLEMNNRRLLCIYNRQHLADTLGVSVSHLERLAATASRKYSHFFAIKKKAADNVKSWRPTQNLKYYNEKFSTPCLIKSL